MTEENSFKSFKQFNRCAPLKSFIGPRKIRSHPGSTCSRSSSGSKVPMVSPRDGRTKTQNEKKQAQALRVA